MRSSIPSGRRRAVVAGVGGWVPPRVVTNRELAERLDTSDEWIRGRTGIRTRHVVGHDEATSDIAIRAGAAALRSAAANGTEEPVDLVVLATSTPDSPCPATAPVIASGLGLPNVPAFDVSAVCSGFVYGLAIADGMIANGMADRVLLIGADVFSAIVNPKDRATAVVFGDGAGAVVLRAGEADEPGALHAADLGSDGDLAALITVRAGGSRHPIRHEVTDEADRWFAMQGQAVYRHAVTRMTDSARTVLASAGWAPGDVDRFVGHQANIRILDAVGARLGISPERIFANVAAVGNTVAASIPLALADATAAGELRAGDRVLLSAFGGGATWGAAALTWPDLSK